MLRLRVSSARLSRGCLGLHECCSGLLESVAGVDGHAEGALLINQLQTRRSGEGGVWKGRVSSDGESRSGAERQTAAESSHELNAPAGP